MQARAAIVVARGPDSQDSSAKGLDISFGLVLN